MEGPIYKGREVKGGVGGERGRGRVPRLLRFPLDLGVLEFTAPNFCMFSLEPLIVLYRIVSEISAISAENRQFFLPRVYIAPDEGVPLGIWYRRKGS